MSIKRNHNEVFPDAQPILQYDLDGIFLNEYASAVEAAIYLGIDKDTVLNHKKQEIGMSAGYLWRLKEDGFKPGENIDVVYFPYIQDPYKRGVCQYDLKGRFVKSYESLTEAAREMGKRKSAIMMACNDEYIHHKTVVGFYWKYKEEECDCPKNIEVEGRRNTAIRIHQYDLKGNFIKTFESLTEAGMSFGGEKSYKNISTASKKQGSTAYGFVWVRDQDSKPRRKTDRKKVTTVYQYGMNWNLIGMYDSIKKASLHTRIDQRLISNAIHGRQKTSYGFYWTTTLKNLRGEDDSR